MTAMKKRELLTARQLEERYGVPEHTWKNMRYRGEGPPYIALSERKTVYDAQEVETWIETRRR